MFLGSQEKKSETRSEEELGGAGQELGADEGDGGALHLPCCVKLVSVRIKGEGVGSHRDGWSG